MRMCWYPRLGARCRSRPEQQPHRRHEHHLARSGSANTSIYSRCSRSRRPPVPDSSSLAAAIFPPVSPAGSRAPSARAQRRTPTATLLWYTVIGALRLHHACSACYLQLRASSSSAVPRSTLTYVGRIAACSGGSQCTSAFGSSPLNARRTARRRWVICSSRQFRNPRSDVPPPVALTGGFQPLTLLAWSDVREPSEEFALDAPDLPVRLVAAAPRPGELRSVHGLAIRPRMSFDGLDRPLLPGMRADVGRPASTALHEPLALAPFPRTSAAVAQRALHLLHHLIVKRGTVPFPVLVVLHLAVGVAPRDRVDESVTDPDGRASRQTVTGPAGDPYLHVHVERVVAPFHASSAPPDSIGARALPDRAAPRFQLFFEAFAHRDLSNLSHVHRVCVDALHPFGDRARLRLRPVAVRSGGPDSSGQGR